MQNQPGQTATCAPKTTTSQSQPNLAQSLGVPLRSQTNMWLESTLRSVNWAKSAGALLTGPTTAPSPLLTSEYETDVQQVTAPLAPPSNNQAPAEKRAPIQFNPDRNITGSATRPAIATQEQLLETGVGGGADEKSQAQRFITRLKEVASPVFDDRPSPLYQRMLDAIETYKRTGVLSCDLRAELDDTILQADQSFLSGAPPIVHALEHELVKIGEELRRRFPKSMRVKAQELKEDVDRLLAMMPVEEQFRYRLYSELLTITRTQSEQEAIFNELRAVNAYIADRTEKLNALTAPALDLAQRHQRVQTALDVERNLPSRIRYTYAEMLIADSSRSTQIRALTVGKMQYRTARKLLREAAYSDRTLLSHTSFLMLARRTGLVDLLMLAEQSID